MMKAYKSILLLLIIVLLAGCAAPIQEAVVEVPTTPAENEPRELIWSDEFDGEIINPKNWTFELGDGSQYGIPNWGNGEMQYYTDRSENVRVENGILIIEALEENYGRQKYTSARIKTEGLQSFQYGRVEARIKLPTGKGVWSAFWMLGDNLDSAVWPNNGEIDIMENIGDPMTVYGTVHGPGYFGGSSVGSPYNASDISFADDFHTYAIEWQPDRISWFVDDVLFNSISDEDVPGEWVYNHDFFILLNLAVGGDWPGKPDETTVFPQQILVDYVRVYRGIELTEEDLVMMKEALVSGSIHIAEMDMEMEDLGDAWQGTAYVTVVDEGGNPVEGAAVSAGWVGAASGATFEAKTDENGIAGPFIAKKLSSKKELSFCVSKISKSLYEYDKDSNVSNCVFKSPEE